MPAATDWPVLLVSPPKPAGPPAAGKPGLAALVPVPEAPPGVLTPGKEMGRSSRIERPSSERRLSASLRRLGRCSLVLGLYVPL